MLNQEFLNLYNVSLALGRYSFGKNTIFKLLRHLSSFHKLICVFIHCIHIGKINKIQWIELFIQYVILLSNYNSSKMKKLSLFLLVLFVISCKQEEKP